MNALTIASDYINVIFNTITAYDGLEKYKIEEEYKRELRRELQQKEDLK